MYITSLNGMCKEEDEFTKVNQKSYLLVYIQSN